MTCLMCGYPIVEVVSLKELFSFIELSKQTVCSRCLASFTRLKGSCQGCQKKTTVTYCYDCLTWQELTGYLPEHQALYCYDEVFKQWLEQFKFKGYYHLGSLFKKQISQEIKKYAVDYVIPIPISDEKLSHRGFNQVEVLLDFSKIRYHTILNKEKEIASQVSKAKTARMNTDFNFSIQKNYLPQLKNKRLLLVDDVYTTGSTLQHAALLFYECGVTSVQTFSLAR